MRGAGIDRGVSGIMHIGGTITEARLVRHLFGAVRGAAAATGGRLASGTRNIVWQCWHLTSFPRTSSGTERIFRHLMFGQIN